MKRILLAERPLATAVGIGFALWAILQVIVHVLWVLVLVLVALILAAAMTPIVRLMRRIQLPPRGWRIPKWAAGLSIYLAGAVIIGVLGYLAEQALLPELLSLIESLPQIAQELVSRVELFRRSSGLTWLIPSGEEIQQQIGALATNIVTHLAQVESFTGGVIWFFFELFFVLILALFLIEESEPILAFCITLFPLSKREHVRATTARIGDRVGRWILGQLTVATITAVLAGFGSFLLGLPYPFLIGVTTGLLELAPIIGPSLMAIPAGLLGLTQSPLTAILAVLLFYGLSLLDGHLLTPLITGRFVRLRLTLVAIAVPVGLALYGALGALVAIPVTAALVVIADEALLPWLRQQEELPRKERLSQEPDQETGVEGPQ